VATGVFGGRSRPSSEPSSPRRELVVVRVKTRARISTHAAHRATRDALPRFIRLGLPVYCGSDRRREVALTFDDGPGPWSAYALGVLRRARAHATFFEVGKELSHWPRLPRMEASLAAIGDHTFTHPFLIRLSGAQIDHELRSAQTAIAKAAHVAIRLFRPPYGSTDVAVAQEARSLGMVEVIWSLDSGDSWPGADAAKIVSRVERYLRPGSIVLMHENRGQTLEALRYWILPLLAKRHLRPVSIPTLLATDPPSLRQLREGLLGCGRPIAPGEAAALAH
jgi:peptidoglycan/xylan/chitin deacetylase (PgdA/CDA1 family)